MIALLTPLIGAILNFLGGPFAANIVKAYAAKLTAENSAEATAAALAARELDVQQREDELQTQLKIAEVGHPWEIEKLFAYIVLIYFAKVIVWDKVLAIWTGGRTDPVDGAVGVWMGMVISYFFAKRSVETVFRIWKGK